ncbi:hypothetical protein RvVAR0630_11490 [Agrobacterium vitis]|uniref:hypothetical protein n=1 Tax=Agrobacterium vitis TaxID=373 RepID=UPI0015D77430|nr:hypothetical protein [Agrobacterium vitis]BCH58525.1 hypothetical protein RvVAR0630_11490 [Agrobacterium vitis]
MAVLQAGQNYLNSHPDTDECPLCRSQDRIDVMGEDIANRLRKLEGFRKASDEHKQSVDNLSNAEKAITQLKEEYKNAVEIFETAISNEAWKDKLNLPGKLPPQDYLLIGLWIAENEHLSNEWAKLEASWIDQSKFLAALRAASDRYDKNLRQRMALDEIIPRVEKALEICIQERQKFTEKVIGDIAQEVGNLYETIHPGEGLAKISFALDPKKRASIELGAQFSGKGVPPQAYFSQSHLDTLGLCVFLALAMRGQPDKTILILDDVLGSVDEPHVERVIGTIYEMSQKFFHTIVTTHYRPWREKFRWGVLKPSQPCQFVELKQWTLNDGISLINSLPEVEKLRVMLADPNPDIQAVCGKAGVVLEALLDFLTLTYGCAVPRRVADKYTLGELLPAINGKLLTSLRVQVIDNSTVGGSIVSEIEIKPILDGVKEIAQTRNVMGAHFNNLAFELYPNDGLKFARLVETLAGALVCNEYGWPSRDKTGSYWNNGGDTRRLHPLKKPS